MTTDLDHTSSAAPAIVCKWYVACDLDADGVVQHPILGAVPTCGRCAERHDLELERFD